MSERINQILSVTAAVLMLAGLAFAWSSFRPRPTLERVTCPDGHVASAVIPDAFLGKYSGRSIVADLSWADRLETSVKVEAQLLERARELTQALDQRLGPLLVEQIATACSEQGRGLLARMEAYRNGDFVRILEQWDELKRIAELGDPAQRQRAESILREQLPAAVSAANERLAPRP
jgi:hypothetical protein